MDQTFIFSADGSFSETTRTIFTAIIPDGDKYSDGITVTQGQGQGNACTDSNYEFVTIILCDTDITGDRNALVENVVFDTYDTNKVTTDDPCVVTMTFKHEKGCQIVDLFWVNLIFMYNEWLVGIIFILAGLLFGLFGLRFLNFLASILGFFTVLLH